MFKPNYNKISIANIIDYKRFHKKINYSELDSGDTHVDASELKLSIGQNATESIDAFHNPRMPLHRFNTLMERLDDSKFRRNTYDFRIKTIINKSCDDVNILAAHEAVDGAESNTLPHKSGNPILITERPSNIALINGYIYVHALKNVAKLYCSSDFKLHLLGIISIECAKELRHINKYIHILDDSEYIYLYAKDDFDTSTIDDGTTYASQKEDKFTSPAGITQASGDAECVDTQSRGDYSIEQSVNPIRLETEIQKLNEMLISAGFEEIITKF